MTVLQNYLKSFYDLLDDARASLTLSEYEVWFDIATRKLAQDEFGREVDTVISRRPW